MKRRTGVTFFAWLICFIVWMGIQLRQQGDFRSISDASVAIRAGYVTMVVGFVLMAIGWPAWLPSLWSRDGVRRAATASTVVGATGSVIASIGFIIVILS